MPIQVDHDERRVLLAQAVWRLVACDGVSAASVRGISRETGLSMGSIRHFFSTQDELLHFAVAELVEQVRQRIGAGTADRLAAVDDGRPLDAAAALLEEVLPLDDQRLLEARVWAAFTVPPGIRAQMADTRRQVDDGVRQLCQRVLALLGEAGILSRDRDLAIETERIHALLDGLTLHLLLDSAGLSAKSVRTILLAHLHDLGTAPRA